MVVAVVVGNSGRIGGAAGQEESREEGPEGGWATVEGGGGHQEMPGMR